MSDFHIVCQFGKSASFRMSQRYSVLLLKWRVLMVFDRGDIENFPGAVEKN
jgi:hypothetical protein